MAHISMFTPTEQIRRAVDEALKDSGGGVRSLERSLGLDRWFLRGITDPKRQQQPSIERADRICRALGIAVTIGTDTSTPVPDPAALPPDTETHRWGDRRGKEVTPYEVPIRDGHQPKVGWSPNGCASYGLDFLLDFDLNPKLCEVIEFHDASMAPEFPVGAAGLVDLRPQERVDGWVYVLGVPDLTVRRAQEGPDGWMAVADNPAFGAMPWTDDFRIIGKVVWTSHMVHTEPITPPPPLINSSPA